MNNSFLIECNFSERSERAQPENYWENDNYLITVASRVLANRYQAPAVLSVEFSCWAKFISIRLLAGARAVGDRNGRARWHLTPKVVATRCSDFRRIRRSTRRQCDPAQMVGVTSEAPVTAPLSPRAWDGASGDALPDIVALAMLVAKSEPSPTAKRGRSAVHKTVAFPLNFKALKFL